MDTNRILSFLSDIRTHNNREWFISHKAEYDYCKRNFEADVEKAILKLASFDDEIAHLQVKDCVYRFYRDIRFSPDKSPYKRHFGAYICSKGKKALRGGYYIHVEPGNCMIAIGSYWLPTNILTACRNEIMGNIDAWLEGVENKKFVQLFGHATQGDWEHSAKGFGLTSLKTAPSGFPRDYEHVEYLRMKDYCCWHRVADNFFEGDAWLKPLADICKTAKPMMDFVNSVIDDYE